MSSYPYGSYSSSSYSSGADAANPLVFIIVFLLIILYLAAWVMTMMLVCNAAREKGYSEITGQLWFIGLFGFVFTPALIVAALPNKEPQKTNVVDESTPTDLPSL